MQNSLKYEINYKLVVYVVGGKSERKYVARSVRKYQFFFHGYIIYDYVKKNVMNYF